MGFWVALQGSSSGAKKALAEIWGAEDKQHARAAVKMSRAFSKLANSACRAKKCGSVIALCCRSLFGSSLAAAMLL